MIETALGISISDIRKYNERANGIKAELKKRAPLIAWDVWTIGGHADPEKLDPRQWSVFYIRGRIVINGQLFEYSHDITLARYRQANYPVLDEILHDASHKFAKAITDWRPDGKA